MIVPLETTARAAQENRLDRSLKQHDYKKGNDR
jgi:hypothetical protein